MNQFVSPRGNSLLYYVIFLGAAISAFSPLILTMNFVSTFLVVTISTCLMIFSFSRTEKGLRFISFSRDAYKELRKVTWPKKAETQQSVIAVSICVFVAALFFWLTDSIIIKLIEWVISFAS